MKRASLILLVAVAVLVCGAGQAKADGITYTESAGASVFLPGVQDPFDQFVTITFTGDTTNVTSPSPGILANEVGMGTITIGTIGTLTFTDSLAAFVNQNTESAGIVDLSVPCCLNGFILDTFNASFATYDLASAIGPISGTGSSSSGSSFGTDIGLIRVDFSSIVDGSSTFTATVVPTPEPNCLMLLGTALAGLAMVRRRLVA